MARAKNNVMTPAATRETLLEAGAEVFARHGYESATIREICQRAGANIAAVNYHFGDKEGLYAEVLKHALSCARQKYPPQLGTTPKSTPEEKLRAFVESFLLRIFDDSRHAWHGKLMAREMIAPTAALDRLVAEEFRPMADLLRKIVGELLGGKPTEEELRLSSMSVVAQILFYHHCRPVVSRMFPHMKLGAEAAPALAEHITQFSLRALGASPTAPKPSRRR